MVGIPMTKDDDGRRLSLIPVIKLPAEKLDSCLEALGSADKGLRELVVDYILTYVYPRSQGFTEKRAMRALVAPALTRLHFARSRPPYFQMAPNGLIWQATKKELRQAYVSVCLFDFALVGLKLSRNTLPPHGSLRDTAKRFSAVMVDRVRGLGSMLSFYVKFHPELAKPLDDKTLKVKVAAANEYLGNNESLIRLLEVSLPRGRIVQIDTARSFIMRKVNDEGKFVTSFVVDEWLGQAMRGLKLRSFKAPYASIDSLMEDSSAIGAVMLPAGG